MPADRSPPRLPLGISNFRQIRREGKLYVDKTLLIADVLDDPAQVLLLPRPRRFGKTTNLSTLRYFLERHPEDRSELFADLAIWQVETARQHFQRYPVVMLTFKDLKATSFEHCFAELSDLLADLYDEHRALLTSNCLSEREIADFRAIHERRADQAQLKAALKKLCRYLHRHHGEPVVVLIDEYDTPLHDAFFRGYFDQALDLFRGLLSGALKDNDHLFKALITGILRVARESIFSDLNNIIVYSLLEPRFAAYFGFTEPEVEVLARRADFPGELAELRAWYNGYVFGGAVIYNPWSVLTALSHGTCAPYWTATSANEVIHELLLRASAEQHLELEALLQGGTLRKPLHEHTALREVLRAGDALWSFLLFAGYLRASEVRREQGGTRSADLEIPNRELNTVFTQLFGRWLGARLGGESEALALTQAILAGDAPACQRYLSRLLVDSMSSWDTAPAARMPPEQLYHVFVLGLLVHLQPRHRVRSSRESGHGRPDVLLLPRQPGDPGVVLELKVRRGRQTLAQALAQGLEQLRAQDYSAELRAHGAAPIHALAVAFDGKHVLVDALAPAPPRKPRRPPRG